MYVHRSKAKPSRRIVKLSGDHLIRHLENRRYNRGATASASVLVIVSNVASTANAGADQQAIVGASINLSAAGSSEPGNDIVGYAWDFDDDGLYDDAAGVSAVFTAATARTYTVRVQVTDRTNSISSDSMTITAVNASTTKFYVVNDLTSDRTYEYDANGNSIENYTINSVNTTPRGVASNAAGTKVWVADRNRNVYV